MPSPSHSYMAFSLGNIWCMLIMDAAQEQIPEEVCSSFLKVLGNGQFGKQQLQSSACVSNEAGRNAAQVLTRLQHEAHFEKAARESTLEQRNSFMWAVLLLI